LPKYNSEFVAKIQQKYFQNPVDRSELLVYNELTKSNHLREYHENAKNC
jgi:hypothetical protein